MESYSWIPEQNFECMVYKKVISLWLKSKSLDGFSFPLWHFIFYVQMLSIFQYEIHVWKPFIFNHLFTFFFCNFSVLYISIHKYLDGTEWPYLRESDYDHIGKGAGLGFNVNIPLNVVSIQVFVPYKLLQCKQAKRTWLYLLPFLETWICFPPNIIVQECIRPSNLQWKSYLISEMVSVEGDNLVVFYCYIASEI